MHATLKALAFAGLALALFAPPAAAQVSNCQAIAERLPGAKLWRAATGGADAYSVDITYVGHSTFRIVAPDGTTIATDYSGTHGGDRLPDVVTMNHAHSSHWTPVPDPGIPHALKGWNPEGGRANHFLNVGEVLDPQRPQRHPHLGRPGGGKRQLHLRVRDRGPVHRPPRPPPPGTQ